ncbi:MAG: sulfotransferase [Deltaproteobacteria bacterium]|nr:sulfotransferase [Deltaproteobacteria bacterium]
MRSKWNTPDTRPIFVVGAGRSGTKFLMNILNNSPYIHIAPEIHYFSSLVHEGFLKNLRRRVKRAGKFTLDELVCCLQGTGHFGTYWRRGIQFPAREIAEWFGQVEINERSIHRFIIEKDYMENGGDKERVKYMGEKTPSNVFHLKRLFRWYPEATVLFIYRNPVDVLRSEVNKACKPDYPLPKGSLLYPYGLAVYVFCEWLAGAIIAVYYRLKRGDSLLIVSYEQLCCRTREITRRICGKIGVPYARGLCKVERIDSSYSRGTGRPHWHPPGWISLFYRISLAIPIRILDGLSLGPQ